MASEGRGGINTSKPKRGTKVIQMGRPGGGGWFYTGRQTPEGTPEWVYSPGGHDYKPTGNPGGGGGGGGGGGYGGGGGGGGAAANPGLSTYIQEYRLRFHPGGDPPAAILKAAKDGKWSLAYFDQQIRAKDPKYWRSTEGKGLLVSFNKTMRILFPGLSNKAKQAALMKSPFYKREAMWYLKNGIGLTKNGEESLYGHITNTKRWNKANPHWKAYSRNKNAAVISEANPVMYKSYLDDLKQSFERAGVRVDKGDGTVGLPDDYFRTFFKSRYASKSGFQELQENLKGYVQQSGSLAWMQGQAPTKGQTKTAILGTGPGATDLRSRLAKSFNVQTSFFGTEPGEAETAMSKSGKLIKPLL